MEETNYNEMTRQELIDMLIQRHSAVERTNENLRSEMDGVQRRLDTLRADVRDVVEKFRQGLVNDEKVVVNDFDDLREVFDKFEQFCELDPPLREVAFSVTLSTVVSGKMFVTDPNLDESDAEERLIDQMDLFQNVDFLPNSCDGIEDIETDNYYLDFEVEDSSFDWED